MRILLALLLAGAASPAFAQSADCPPEHAAMGHCKPAPAPAPAPVPQPPATDPHAGHTMPTQPADPHAGHDMGATAADVPVGPPPPEALSGPEHAADTAWGAAAMEQGRAVLFAEHGDMATRKFLVDQLEARVRDGRDGYFLNAEGWFGGDIDKLWLKTEIEGAFGRKPEQAEVQALWSHAINPWFDLQLGVRLDAQPDTRGRLVLGVEGLAPYWIEIDAAAFLSDKGDVTARFEAEHEVRLTQKLTLQPRAEVDFSLQDIEREHVGSGLSSAELGLRLRYQLEPNFAPYIGVAYERAFGDMRRFLRAEGDDPDSLSLVAGLRAWF
jgi:copper resistance protein B